LSYTLDNAVTDLKKRSQWLTRSIVKQPLVGVVDSSNKLFLLPHAPATSGSLTLYNSTGTAISAATYTADTDTGEVVFDTAPTDVVYASYTAEALTNTQLTNVVTEGFAKMQEVYKRSWYLFTSGATTYISLSSTADSEPTLGGQALSNNVVQKRLYMLCCQYVLERMLYEDAALHDHLFRESGRVGGMLVDMTKRPPNIDAMLERMDGEIVKAAAAAADNAGDTTAFGYFIPGAQSDEYYYGYDWFRNSRQARGVID